MLGKVNIELDCFHYLLETTLSAHNKFCTINLVSYDHYKSVRGDIALPKNELLPIDAADSSQTCTTFGLHPNLGHVKDLYDEGDLLWVSNVGVIQEKTDKSNWPDIFTVLFAHNIQSEEVQNVDIFKKETRGVGGRMADILKGKGFSPAEVSLSGVVDAIVSSATSLFVLDPFAGLETLNPIPWTQQIWSNVKKLNPVANFGSNIFGEVWSDLLYKAVGDNKELKDTLDSATLLTNTFPGGNELASQLELISKLIKMKDSRGKFHSIYWKLCYHLICT